MAILILFSQYLHLYYKLDALKICIRFCLYLHNLGKLCWLLPWRQTLFNFWIRWSHDQNLELWNKVLRCNFIWSHRKCYGQFNGVNHEISRFPLFNKKVYLGSLFSSKEIVNLNNWLRRRRQFNSNLARARTCVNVFYFDAVNNTEGGDMSSHVPSLRVGWVKKNLLLGKFSFTHEILRNYYFLEWKNWFFGQNSLFFAPNSWVRHWFDVTY